MPPIVRPPPGWYLEFIERGCYACFSLMEHPCNCSSCLGSVVLPEEISRGTTAVYDRGDRGLEVGWLTHRSQNTDRAASGCVWSHDYQCNERGLDSSALRWVVV